MNFQSKNQRKKAARQANKDLLEKIKKIRSRGVFNSGNYGGNRQESARNDEKCREFLRKEVEALSDIPLDELTNEQIRIIWGWKRNNERR